jgi:hypothetical protein
MMFAEERAAVPDDSARTPVEEALLGCAFSHEPGRFAKMRERIKARDFDLPTHQALWRALCDFDNLGRALDGPALRLFLEEAGRLDEVGGAQFLAQVWMADPLADWEVLLATLRDRAFRRAAETIAFAFAQDAAVDPTAAVRRVHEETGRLLASFDRGGLVLTPFARVPRRRVEWAAPGIPVGEITEVVGEVAQGKSSLCWYWAAQATRGALPGVFKGRPVNVIVTSTEDDAERVLGPRLLAAGADMDRVLCPRYGADEYGVIRPEDVRRLGAFVEEYAPVGFVMFDPLIAYIEGDLYKSPEVRRLLLPLQRLARRSGSRSSVSSSSTRPSWTRC